VYRHRGPYMSLIYLIYYLHTVLFTAMAFCDVTSLGTVKSDFLRSSIFCGGLFFCDGLFFAVVYFLQCSIFSGGLFFAVVYFCGCLFMRCSVFSRLSFCGDLYFAIFTHRRLREYHNKQSEAICT